MVVRYGALKSVYVLILIDATANVGPFIMSLLFS